MSQAILAALMQSLGRQAPNDPLGLGGGVPTAQQQGLGPQQSPFSPQPPTPPLPNSQQEQGGQGAGGQGTGLMAILAKILQNPGVLNSIGQVGSAFAGRDQLADFQRVTGNKQAVDLAKQRAEQEKRRIDISAGNLEVNRGSLEARNKEVAARKAEADAKVVAAETKAKRDNKVAVVDLKLKNKLGVTEAELVDIYGEAARGLSITPALKAGELTLNVPEGHRYRQLGLETVTTTPGELRLMLDALLPKEEGSQTKLVTIGGKIVAVNTANDEAKVIFELDDEPKEKVARPTTLKEQKDITEYLEETIDGWDTLSLGARTKMVNLYISVLDSGQTPQPVTSTYSREAWELMGFVVRKRQEEEKVLGFTGPGLTSPDPSITNVDQEIEDFLNR